MVSKLYREMIKPYRALLDENLSLEQIDRASKIQQIVVQDPRIIEEAYRLVEEEGFVPPSGTKITEKKLKHMATYEVQAIINVATFAVAERETDRGTPFRDDQLRDIMTEAMRELYQGKLKTQLHENGQTSFQR